MSDSGDENRVLATLPTRIITYAWGQRYIDELLSLTLPAALAPGNLPYVTSVCPCVFIILTQEIFFERIINSPVVSRIRKLCPVRLIGLDDLIVAPDKYGMTLTYALHRGFVDLGPKMTDHWLIFFNADFILADGNWRNLVTHLARGERLVASPSYCVRSAEVVSELRNRLDTRASTLVLQPRELASLVLQHRHDTVRAKTVNQRLYSARYMDQFYWLVGDNTLLGHQMPVSIVGMRPERFVKEPNSYWDHGFMRELCPEAKICVIGDSDEFLMMELREKEVAADQISAGWPSLSEIGKRMIIWVTPYQRDFARYPLTLHAGDLPLQTDEARRQLRAFVDEVLCHAPPLPSHIDHPQWDYHSRAFIETRHKNLSARLGSATADSPPPEDLSEIDKTWWRLDGLAKSYLRRRSEVTELMDQERDLVRQARARLEEDTGRCGEKLFAKLLALKPDANYSGMIPWRELDGAQRTEGAVIGNPVRSNYAPWVSAIADYEAEYQNERKIEHRRLLTRITEFIDKSEETQLQSLELEFEAARRELQNDYERLLPKSLKSAAPIEAGESDVTESTGGGAAEAGGEEGAGEAEGAGEVGAAEAAGAAEPEAGEPVRHVLVRGPVTHAPGLYPSPIFLRSARLLYQCVFGRVPRVRMLHPYWAPLRHLVRLVDRAFEEGARDVLVVGSGVADGIADHLPGVHARLSLAEVLGRNLDQVFDLRPEFDLCICTLTIGESGSVPELVRMVTPYMRVGAKFIIFLPNLELNDDFRSNKVNRWPMLGDLSSSVRVYFAGKARSARILQRLHDVRSSSYVKRLLTFFLVVPQAIVANKEEAGATEGEQSMCPASCTSVTIEISIGSKQSQDEMPMTGLASAAENASQ